MPVTQQSLSYIRRIAPYQPGKPITALARETGIPVNQIVKLASNENPLGMSPLARKSLDAALDSVHRYPDPFDLICKLAGHLGLDPGQVILGNGSNDVLELVAKVFLAPGRSAVFSAHAFAVYPLATQAAGAECIVAPARNYGHDLDAIQAAIRPDTRVVWIANPNNPTGTFLPPHALRVFLGQVPDSVLVVLDEAYNEYLEPSLREDTVRWMESHPNLVITRTFSKIYGLAGLRVGYALVSPEVADLLNRVRQPFNVNNLGLAAAFAALDDADFLERSYSLNRQGLEQICTALDKMGLAHLPAHGNFVTFRAGNEDSAGDRVNQALLKQGVIVRPIGGGYGMPAWLRVTIGSQQENARFLEALSSALPFSG